MPYLTLDAWRGLAALAVVAYHAGLVVGAHRLGAGDAGLYAYTHYGYLGVPVFFVISGYCISAAALSGASRQRGPHAFAYARLRRVFPPYWAALLLAVGAMALAVGLARAGVVAGTSSSLKVFRTTDLGFWVGNLTLTHLELGRPMVLAVSWTLAYEIAFYAVTYLALIVFRQSLRVIDGLHAVTLVSSVLLSLFGRVIFPLELWPQFGLGVLAYDVLRHGLSRRTATWTVVIALAMGLCLVNLQGVNGPMESPYVLGYAVATGFTVLLIGLHQFDRYLAAWPPVQMLRWCGIFSYSLYLTHFVLLGVTNQLTRRIIPVRWHELQFLLSFAIAIAFGFAFWFVVERPMMTKRQVAREPERLEASTAALDESVASRQLRG